MTNQGPTDVLPSLVLDPRPAEGQGMTLEDERDYFKKRFYSLSIVLRELQQQMSHYKNRCAGVDTVTLLLKESKQEVVRLNRQCKVLETAVANIQNRLSINGLSCNLAIEETELFVPGASKQTLDNLARENGRLRSLLKNSDFQSAKKPSEDVVNLKSDIERLEAENAQLYVQLDGLKATIKDQTDAVTVLREQGIKTGLESDQYSERISRGTQTAGLAPTALEKLRDSLKQVTDHCADLTSQLEEAQIIKEDSEKEYPNGNFAQPAHIENELSEYRDKYKQVVMMNQRWQQFHEAQERDILALRARTAEFEDPRTIQAMVGNATAVIKQEATILKDQLDAVNAQNVDLKQRVETLTKNSSTQPQFDPSIVEILKQQIQACTEDFNIERKDREMAVHRAEQLQADLAALKVQLEKLRTDNENLKQRQASQFNMVEGREAQPILQSPTPVTALSHIHARGPSTPSLHSLQGLSLPQPHSLAASQGIPYHLIPRQPVRGPNISSWALNCSSGESDYICNNDEEDMATPEFLSMQGASEVKGVQGGLSKYNNVASMPVFSGQQSRNGEELSCPKCNKKYIDHQSEDLLKHIDSCTA